MELTNGITLPASTALAETGAVHHVALIMTFSKSLIHIISQAIHNALVWEGQQHYLYFDTYDFWFLQLN